MSDGRGLTFGEASWVGDLWAEVSLTGGPDRVVHDDPCVGQTTHPVGFAQHSESPRRYALGFAFKWSDLMNEARRLAVETGRRWRVSNDGCRSRRHRWTAANGSCDRSDRGDCEVCGGTFALMTPRLGDGSKVVLRNHGPRRKKCPGSRHEPTAAPSPDREPGPTPSEES